MMIKSNGGSGSVSNVLLQNFISQGTAYGLYINQYWSSMSPIAGNGVKLSNIKFSVSSIAGLSYYPYIFLRIGMEMLSTVSPDHQLRLFVQMEHLAQELPFRM